MFDVQDKSASKNIQQARQLRLDPWLCFLLLGKRGRSSSNRSKQTVRHSHARLNCGRGKTENRGSAQERETKPTVIYEIPRIFANDAFY